MQKKYSIYESPSLFPIARDHQLLLMMVEYCPKPVVAATVSAGGQTNLTDPVIVVVRLNSVMDGV